MPAPSIHHDVTFEASPKEVFAELLDADRFAAFTGAPAAIDPVEGGSFSLFGGQILGRNIELVDGERVVQAWRVAHWEPGVYSLIRFELRASGAGTELGFDQWGHPTDAHDDLDAGWHTMYWEPMRSHLGAS
jgi:activator of HSP90 ATPase